MPIVSGGPLPGGIRVSWIVNGAAPLFASGVVRRCRRRGAAPRHEVPGAPGVYYSLGLADHGRRFLLTMAVLEGAAGADPEWRFASIGFYLVGSGACSDTSSPRAPGGRAVHRPELLRQSPTTAGRERVSRAITLTARPEDIASRSSCRCDRVRADRVVFICATIAAARSGACTRCRAPAISPRPARGPSARRHRRHPAGRPAIASCTARRPLVFQEAAQDLT
jgi:hypothetical protein